MSDIFKQPSAQGFQTVVTLLPDFSYPDFPLKPGILNYTCGFSVIIMPVLDLLNFELTGALKEITRFIVLMIPGST